MHKFVFDAQRKRCRPHFPASIDHDVARAGRPSTYDYVDCVAVVLRRLNLDCKKASEVSQIEFFRGRGTIAKILTLARQIVASVLVQWPEAVIRYPSLGEARLSLDGVFAQYSNPRCPHDMAAWAALMACLQPHSRTASMACASSEKQQSCLHSGAARSI